MCQPNNVPHVKGNVLYSIWSLYSLFLFNFVNLFLKKWSNFVPLQIETKSNFYINVIMFLLKFIFY